VTRVAAVGAAFLVFAASASATTGAEVRRLAAAAPTDPASLGRLRAITVVDGRHVDLARALRTASRPELLARLRTLAAPVPPARAFAAAREARQILHERRFHGSRVPRPFHGVLVWIGARLSPLGSPFTWLARRIPGGAWTLWLVLAGVVVLASAAVAGRTARRRGANLLQRDEHTRRGRTEDPARLERHADAAENAGDLEAALRLRFRAGLLRLGRARVVPLRTSLTSGEARRLIRLPDFDRIAGAHDEIVYGGRQARVEDTADARERWPIVLRSKGVQK
jgi:hypothetical protein